MAQLFKPNISEDAIKAANKVLRSGWIGPGPKVDEFEKRFAEYIDIKYAVALNSCTAALHLAVIISEIKEGDEVITTPLTFVSTNHCILYQRAIPVFADIDPKTYCISPPAIEKMLTKKTKAIMVMHYGGHPAELDRIYKIAREHNLKVIEDAAHACGAEYKGKKIGSFGLTCFSFQSVKNLTTADGGMLTLDNKEQYERLKKISWMGIDKSTYARAQERKSPSSIVHRRRTADGGQNYSWQYDVTETGYKYHMNDVMAAIGIEQLKLLDEQNRYRRGLAELYSKNLKHPDIIALPCVSPDVVTSQHLYVIQVKRRNDLIYKLKANGVEAGVHYILATEFPMYNKARADINVAKKIVKNIITLPMHTFLKEEDVLKITELINKGW